MAAPEQIFDAVIVGAGPVGATLALALTKAGLQVALIDAQPVETRLAANFDGRAWAVAWGNVLQLRALGVADALEPHAEPVTAILVTEGSTPAAAAGTARLGALGFEAADVSGDTVGAPHAWMVENRHLRAALNTAVEAAAVSVFAPAHVEAVEAGAARARVRLADGRALTTALVVAADGKGSWLRQDAGIGVNGWSYRQIGVVATVALPAPHGGVAYEHFMPGSALAALPLTGQRASLVWVESEARARALLDASPQAFEAHLNRRLGDRLGPARLEGERFGYPLGLQVADSLVAPRLALAGDAAHAVHPIAGQGLNMGLKDAAALAEVLVEAKRIGEDLGSPLVLERYARWRRFDNLAFAAATEFFVRAYGSDTPLLRVVRGAVTSAMDRFAPLKRAMMLEADGLLGDPPKLLRGQAL